MANSANELFGEGSHSVDSRLNSWINGDSDGNDVGDVLDAIGSLDGSWSGTPAYATGIKNHYKSLDLSGSNYVTLAAGISYFPDPDYNNFSVCLRFNADSLTGKQVLWETGGAQVCQVLHLDGTTLYALTAGANVAVSASVTVGSGNHSVVMTVDDDVLTLYVDDQEPVTAAVATLRANAGSNAGAIGRANTMRYADQSTADTGAFSGLISDVATFIGVLTAGEAAEYIGGREPLNLTSGTCQVQGSVDPIAGAIIEVGTAPTYNSQNNGTVTITYRWFVNDVYQSTGSTFDTTDLSVGDIVKYQSRGSNDGGYDSAEDTNSSNTITIILPYIDTFTRADNTNIASGGLDWIESASDLEIQSNALVSITANAAAIATLDEDLGTVYNLTTVTVGSASTTHASSSVGPFCRKANTGSARTYYAARINGALSTLTIYRFIAGSGTLLRSVDVTSLGLTKPFDLSISAETVGSVVTITANIDGNEYTTDDSSESRLLTGNYVGIEFYNTGSAKMVADTFTTEPISGLIPATATLTITTYAPEVDIGGNVVVIPTTAALTTTTYAPTATTPEIRTPTTVGLVLTTYNPTVVTSNHQSVTPTTVELTTTPYAPSILTPTTVVPSEVNLTLTTYLPTIETPVNVTPDLLALSITTYASNLELPVNAVPSVVELVLTRYVPTIELPVVTIPSVIDLSTTTYTPVVVASDIVVSVPTTVELTTTGYSPTVVTPNTVIPTTRTLTLTEYAPSVTISDAATFTPSNASLTLTTYEPTIVRPVTTTPTTVTLTLTEYPPTVDIANAVSIVPETAALELTTNIPTVTTTALVQVTPTTVALTLTTNVPTVTGGGDITISPENVELNISSYAPSVETPIVATPIYTELVISTFGPTITNPITITATTAELVLTTYSPSLSGTNPSSAYYYYLMQL